MSWIMQFDTSVENLWNRALNQEDTRWPFYAYSWHALWYQHMGRLEKLMIYSDANNEVLVPLAITGQTAHFTGNEELSDYLDALGNRKQKGAVWAHVLPFLKQAGATTLLLRNIPSSSESLIFFKTIKEADVSIEDAVPILTLPETFDGYVRSLNRKRRHEIRRKMKKFELSHSDIEFLQTNEADTPSLFTLMNKHDQKREFLTPAITDLFTDLVHLTDIYPLQFFLRIGPRTVASVLAFNLNNQSLLLYNSGFDPDVDGSGWYVKTKIIEWAITNSYASVNFLQGNERYKYDLGASDTQVYRVRLNL